MLGAPRTKIVDRSGAKAEVERERRAARLVLENQHDKIIRSYEHASPASPAEQRQRELFDRWAGARTLVDAPTRPEEVPAVTGGATPPKP